MNSFLKIDITLKNLSEELSLDFKGNPYLKIKGIGDINYILRGHSNLNDNFIYYIENKNLIPKKMNLDNIVLILPPDLSNEYETNCIITKPQSKLSFIKLLKWIEDAQFNNEIPLEMINSKSTISPTVKIFPGAFIGHNVTIEDNCMIHPMAVIESDTIIKKGSVIHSGVFIGKHSVIGQNNIIYSNSVIGSDGFGYFDFNQIRYKIPQIGNVITGDNVEIGSCTTIDRSTIESTIIGNNTKIDNQVQIAHNCIIGSNVYIAGKASMAGSVTIGDNSILAGGSGIKDHVNIAPGSIILAMTGIEEDTEPGKIYFGIPARPAREMHKINSSLTYLPDIIKEFKKKK